MDDNPEKECGEDGIFANNETFSKNCSASEEATNVNWTDKQAIDGQPSAMQQLNASPSGSLEFNKQSASNQHNKEGVHVKTKQRAVKRANFSILIKNFLPSVSVETIKSAIESLTSTGYFYNKDPMEGPFENMLRVYIDKTDYDTIVNGINDICGFKPPTTVGKMLPPDGLFFRKQKLLALRNVHSRQRALAEVTMSKHGRKLPYRVRMSNIPDKMPHKEFRDIIKGDMQCQVFVHLNLAPSGANLGSGFLLFETQENALNAIDLMDGVDMGGHEIHLEMDTEHNEKNLKIRDAAGIGSKNSDERQSGKNYKNPRADYENPKMDFNNPGMDYENPRLDYNHHENSRFDYDHQENNRMDYNHHENPRFDYDHHENNRMDYNHHENPRFNYDHHENNSMDYNHYENNSMDYNHYENNSMDNNHYENNSMDYNHHENPRMDNDHQIIDYNHKKMDNENPDMGNMPSSLETFGITPYILKALDVSLPLVKELLVTNLDSQATEADIKELFAVAGSVVKVQNNPKRSQAIVEMSCEVDAVEAICMLHSQEYFDKIIEIRMLRSNDPETVIASVPRGLKTIGQRVATVIAKPPARSENFSSQMSVHNDATFGQDRTMRGNKQFSSFNDAQERLPRRNDDFRDTFKFNDGPQLHKNQNRDNSPWDEASNNVQSTVPLKYNRQDSKYSRHTDGYSEIEFDNLTYWQQSNQASATSSKHSRSNERTKFDDKTRQERSNQASDTSSKRPRSSERTEENKIYTPYDNFSRSNKKSRWSDHRDESNISWGDLQDSMPITCLAPETRSNASRDEPQETVAVNKNELQKQPQETVAANRDEPQLQPQGSVAANRNETQEKVAVNINKPQLQPQETLNRNESQAHATRTYVPTAVGTTELNTALEGTANNNELAVISRQDNSSAENKNPRIFLNIAVKQLLFNFTKGYRIVLNWATTNNFVVDVEKCWDEVRNFRGKIDINLRLDPTCITPMETKSIVDMDRYVLNKRKKWLLWLKRVGESQPTIYNPSEFTKEFITQLVGTEFDLLLRPKEDMANNQL